jgi:hypothetical protein
LRIVKRRGARVIAITTPGWSRSSSCWEVREAARITPGYFFFAPGQSLASWLDQAEIARQRGTLPAHVFKRLHACRSLGRRHPLAAMLHNRFSR